MNRFKISAIVFIIFTIACSGPMKTIKFRAKALFPEGVVYDKKSGTFLVTSLTEGMVSRVDRTGKITPFIIDKQLISAVGIELDRERNRVIVCNSDPGPGKRTNTITQGKLAGIGIYDADTGKKIKYIELSKGIPGGHFANAIAIASDGSIYITDSFSPIIYKVDTNYNVKIFFTDKSLTGEGFNLNGIVRHPDGYLLVAKYNDGTLYKIPEKNPETYTKVKISSLFKGADGIVQLNARKIALISNVDPVQVTILVSKDDWKSAEIIKKYNNPEFDFPTTGALVSGKLFVLNAKLGKLFSGKRDITQFEIIRLD